MIEGPVKVAIRHDKENGVVRAFLMTMDESERREVATLATDFADLGESQAFKSWVVCLQGMMDLWYAKFGLPVVYHDVRKPPDSRGN